MTYAKDAEVSSDESIECEDVEIDYGNLTDDAALRSSTYGSSVHKDSVKKTKNTAELRVSKGKVLNYLRIPKAVDFMSPDLTEYVTEMQRASLIAQLKANKD
ncbi:unnamed protein product [Heterobilharzia americana]|nr:unnamed protein product [Heterobilharzia americana]CAH8502192.1 unnamed protein product [Heterobilharzia americana]